MSKMSAQEQAAVLTCVSKNMEQALLAQGLSPQLLRSLYLQYISLVAAHDVAGLPEDPGPDYCCKVGGHTRWTSHTFAVVSATALQSLVQNGYFRLITPGVAILSAGGSALINAAIGLMQEKSWFPSQQEAER